MSEQYQSAVCCHKCAKELSDMSPAAGSLWAELAKLWGPCGIWIFLKGSDRPELRTLEILKFVVTHEVHPTHILIRMNGFHTKFPSQHYYCINKEKHERADN